MVAPIPSARPTGGNPGKSVRLGLEASQDEAAYAIHRGDVDRVFWLSLTSTSRGRLGRTGAIWRLRRALMRHHRARTRVLRLLSQTGNTMRSVEQRYVRRGLKPLILSAMIFLRVITKPIQFAAVPGSSRDGGSRLCGHVISCREQPGNVVPGFSPQSAGGVRRLFTFSVWGTREGGNLKTVDFKGLCWCCERGLNSRPLPYQGSALPLSYRSAPGGSPENRGS